MPVGWVRHPGVQRKPAGLRRWFRADHAERVTESEEEADIVASEIGRLIGTTWTNQHGEQGPLTVTDVLVVAPYKD